MGSKQLSVFLLNLDPFLDWSLTVTNLLVWLQNPLNYYIKKRTISCTVRNIPLYKDQQHINSTDSMYYIMKTLCSSVMQPYNTIPHVVGIPQP